MNYNTEHLNWQSEESLTKPRTLIEETTNSYQEETGSSLDETVADHTHFLVQENEDDQDNSESELDTTVEIEKTTNPTASSQLKEIDLSGITEECCKEYAQSLGLSENDIEVLQFKKSLLLRGITLIELFQAQLKVTADKKQERARPGTKLSILEKRRRYENSKRQKESQRHLRILLKKEKRRMRNIKRELLQIRKQIKKSRSYFLFFVIFFLIFIFPMSFVNKRIDLKRVLLP